MNESSTKANNYLEQAQNDLNNVSDELAQLYHHVCTVNGEIPSVILLEHEKHTSTGMNYIIAFIISNITFSISPLTKPGFLDRGLLKFVYFLFILHSSLTENNFIISIL